MNIGVQLFKITSSRGIDLLPPLPYVFPVSDPFGEGDIFIDTDGQIDRENR